MDKKKIVTIKVPATSANCGPGFDALGLALTLYNTFTYELLPQGQYELTVEGEGKEDKSMQASPANLAFAGFYKIWRLKNQPDTGLKVHMHNAIPLARGLGSSSSAIVAGLMAANALTGNTFTKEELVPLASELEGHPDNVAPALVGGFTISFMDEGTAHTMRLEPKKPFHLIALIPNMPLSTAKARSVMPITIPLTDGVFSMSRAALLVASLATGDYSQLSLALEDKFHQPYRLPLIPGAKEAIEAAKLHGAYQGIISGAGSTLMAYAPLEADTMAIGKAMQAALEEKGLTSSFKVLAVDLTGAKIEKTLDS